MPRFLPGRYAALMLAFAAALPYASPALADFNALSALASGGAKVSAAVYDLEQDKLVEQLNYDTRLSPASISKLLVASAAYDTWPMDKMFETRVVANGPVSNGVLNGDLILVSSGDAALDHHGLFSLAIETRAAGIHRITGNIKVSTAPFGPLGCETKDRCDALERSATAYNAPISPVNIDYGNWCIDVKALVPGKPAVIASCGGMSLPIPVQGSINTTAANSRPAFWLERASPDGNDVLRVGGSAPAGTVQSVYRAMSDPARGLAQLLAGTLRSVGVQVDGSASVTREAPGGNAITLGTSEGLSLKEQLGRMMRFSNNVIADGLTLQFASNRERKAPATLAEAGAALGRHVARLPRVGGSQLKDAPPLFSGSGLTPESRIAASEMVAVLADEYRNPRTFGAFYGTLVVPRQAPFAFLRTGSNAWLDRVALKTGSMDDPVSVTCIAGYLRKKTGGWMAFAILVNGGPGRRHVPLYQSMEAMRKDLDVVLARY